jgi:hypothetical protein
MNADTLASAITTFLVPHLNSAKAGAQLPDAVNQLWDEITAQFKGRPIAARVAVEFAAAPGDEAALATFRDALKQTLESDTAFAAKLNSLPVVAGGITQGGVKIEDSEEVNVGGDVTGRDKLYIHAESGATVIIHQGGMPATEPTSRAKDETQSSLPVRLFVSYRRHADRDRQFAEHLHQFLTAQGHDVFIDQTMRTGTAWLEEIDEQIKASDFLVVLLSKDSADSEMVQAEVRRAYEYRKAQGYPQTLPVRLAFEGLLPYSLAAFLDPLQYVIWQSEADNERVGQDVLAAITGRLPKQTPITIKPASAQVALSEDGRLLTTTDTLSPPLPEFDPRFLEELEAPGGAIKLRDRFYIEREADARLKREIVKAGTTTTIRASRQTGKSSLLVRGLNHARSNTKIVNLDMQGVDHDHLATPDIFLRYLAGVIVRKLRLDSSEIEQVWYDSSGPQDKFTRLMEDHVLPSSETTIILALDEVDRLLETPFYSDFFALVRSWHNNRALDEQWQKLNIVMVISTEPYLLIADANQSPFNVGLKLYLEDFTEAQVRDLNQRHGSPVRDSDFPQLMTLLGGHPYLTRKALYTLVTEKQNLGALIRVATDDQGPFGDHLRRQHWLLRNERDLQEALRQIIRSRRCDDETALFRLLRAGLVKGSGDAYSCRCDLYARYFKDKLR